MPPPRAGDLLVATPDLVDPNFARTVVLVLDHDGDGTLGVVLNRPSRTDVGEVLHPWRDLASSPGVLFEGGPVSADGALAVAALGECTPGAEPVGWRRMFDAVGVVDLDTPTELLGQALADVRVFVGYAGWGTGQLDDEIAEGAWLVVRSEPGDLFATDPERLWTRVLRRQPGEVAWLSTRPADPTHN